MRARATASSRLVQKIAGAIALIASRDLGEVVAAAGIDAEALADADGRVEHTRLIALWRAGERLTGDASLGLAVAELSRRAPDNVLAYATQSSRKVGDALGRAVRYATILHDALELRVIVERDVARLRVGVRTPLVAARHGIEFALAMTALFCRDRAAGRFELHEASFRHAAPASTAAHEHVFGASVGFERAHDELVFDPALLELPLRGFDEALARHLDRHLELLLARARGVDDWTRRARDAVGASLAQGPPDVAAVAARLQMSARTLQRRLSEAGSSFQGVVDTMRRELAMSYLGDPHNTVTEVAFLLGFSDVAGFCRAFKRWTGTTPAEHRRQAGPTGSASSRSSSSRSA